MSDFQQFFGSPRPLRLPSGAVVIARRPSTISLIASGGFPSELTSLVWKTMQEEGEDKALDSLVGNPEVLRQMAEMWDTYIPHVLVSLTCAPSTNVREEEREYEGKTFHVLVGTLDLKDMRDEDKKYLFLFGMGLVAAIDAKGEVAASSLAPFREGGERADAGHTGEAVRAEAVEPVGAPAERPTEP